MLAECPLATLHGVSAVGTRLAFYSRRGGGPVRPPRIAPDPQMMMDVAPVTERWGSDILTEEGLQKLMAIVDEIKEGCEVLPVDRSSLQLHMLRYKWLRSIRRVILRLQPLFELTRGLARHVVRTLFKASLLHVPGRASYLGMGLR